MNIDELPRNRGLVLPWTKSSRRADIDDLKAEARLPFLRYLPRGSRAHVVAVLGEFIGTFLFLFFAFAATQIANTTDSNAMVTASTDVSRLLYISLAFGFSLAVNAWTFFRISGGLFNPAVTLGMCLIGALTWLRGGLLFVAQMLGAMCSAAVVSALFPGDLAVQTTLGAGTNVAQGLFIEMFLTVQLIFTIFMLAAEKHKATFVAPVGIGLSLFIAEMAGALFTGGSLNPARSFGPCVAQASFPNYHWIYWLGPVLGTCLATIVYRVIKMLEYETANPDQDDDGETKAEITPEAMAMADPANNTRQTTSIERGEGVNRTSQPTSGSVRTPPRVYGYDAGPYLEASNPRRGQRPD